MAKGAKTGGRTKGTRNKKQAEVLAKAEAGGIMPLEVLLTLMREAWTNQSFPVAAEYAKAAAPYCHPKFANVDATIDGDVGLTVEIVRFSEAA
jgi:hypothetical protein